MVKLTVGSPGARFSFSPRMRLLLITSISVMAVAVLLVTEKVIGPAAALLWSTTQLPPLSPVSVIATCEAPFATGAGELSARASEAPGTAASRMTSPAVVMEEEVGLVRGMSRSFCGRTVDTTGALGGALGVALGLGTGRDGLGNTARPDEADGDGRHQEECRERERDRQLRGPKPPLGPRCRG